MLAMWRSCGARGQGPWTRRVGRVAVGGARAYAAVSGEGASSAAAYESNVKSQTNRLEKTLAKFWEKVAVREEGERFAVELDQRVIKTPLGYDLKVPANRKTLAYLLANEWQTLPSLHVRPYLVPLTSLVSRCIDLAEAQKSADPEVRAKVGDLSTIKSLLLRYLDTDTLCIFSPLEDCDGELRKQQEEHYLPFLKEMGTFLSQYGNGPLEITWLDSEVGLGGNTQPEATRAAACAYLDSLDMWQLVALEKAVLTAKSFLVGVAVVRNADPADPFNVSVEELARLATLETVLQTARWGEVEDTHDVDKVDVRRNLAAAALVAHRAN